MAEPARTHARQTDDTEVVAALRRGDEDAFRDLVRRHHHAMLAVARRHVRDRAVAEEVVQETWLGVLRGLDRFQGRSSLRTWVFAILVNRALTTGAREHRSEPIDWGSPDDRLPSVSADRFRGPGDDYPGHWAIPPRRWSGVESTVEAHELRRVVGEAIAALPDAQRTVIALRDIDGWSSDEVCDLLRITAGNQRVLLHRARSKVRAALERYLDLGAR